MSYFQIPLTSSTDQTLNCTIPVDGKNLRLKLRIRYNTVAKYWVMSISDATANTLILEGIPLLTGSNLLGQFGYLGLGSAVIINVGNSSLDSPDDSGVLGTDFLLVWGNTA